MASTIQNNVTNCCKVVARLILGMGLYVCTTNTFVLDLPHFLWLDLHL